MPQTISCPQCRRKLRIPSVMLGKKTRCPDCSVSFHIDSDGEAIEEPREAPPERASPSGGEERYQERRRERSVLTDDGDEEDRRSHFDDEEEEQRLDPRVEKAGWNRVRIGLNLVMMGVMIWLGGLILGSLCFLLTGLIGYAGAFEVAGVMFICSYGLILLSAFLEWVLRLVGYGLCMLAPPCPGSALRPLSITAFSLLAVATLTSLTIVVLAFVLTASSSLTGLMVGGAIMSLLLWGAVVVCYFGSFSVFAFFQRSVCNNVRAQHLRSQPIAVWIGFIVFWIGSNVLYFLVVLIGAYLTSSRFSSGRAFSADASWRSSRTVAVLWISTFLILGVTYLGMNFWYLVVLQRIRDAVALFRPRSKERVS